MATAVKMDSYDTEILNRYEKEEKARQEAIDQCKAETQKQKVELTEASKEIKAEEQAIKKASADLDKESAQLKKEKAAAKTDQEKEAVKNKEDELAKKKSELADRKKENKKQKAENDARIKELSLKKCGNPLSKNRSCVPANESKKMADPLGTLPEEVNKKNGTNIDFRELLKQEGGYSGAYVPWWPINKGSTSPVMTTKNTRSNDPDKNPVVKGSSSSGTTIGVGVDFGPQKNQKDYFKSIDAANKKYEILSKEEADALKKKIEPYMGKTMAEACHYLKENPLDLSEKEIKLLHANSWDYFAAMGAKRPGFKDLSQADQTAQYKKAYNTGSYK
jgi:hypothetical protein